MAKKLRTEASSDLPADGPKRRRATGGKSALRVRPKSAGRRQTQVQPDLLDYPLPSPEWKKAFRRKLLAWYKTHARDLPWRRTRDPYQIWVSEIMLQQTQVATVISYFERFMEAFPTVEALAAAEEEEVLRLWEGLGYYRRARSLHRAAKEVVAQFGGQMPTTAADLQKLPGIGRYTAGAIASIAYDAPEPILEANTIRLFSRLLAYRGVVTSTAGQHLLWALATALVPRSGAGRFNQALMELGAQVCTPRDPQCLSCPALGLCPTQAAGLQAEIPSAAPRPNFEQVTEGAVVVRRRRRVLLLKRGPEERWAGLWDFPRFSLESEDSQHHAEQLPDLVHKATGVQIGDTGPLTTIRHGVTRFRITLHCYEAEVTGGRLKLPGESARWILPADLPSYPLHTSARKLSKLLHAGS